MSLPMRPELAVVPFLSLLNAACNYDGCEMGSVVSVDSPQRHHGGRRVVSQTFA